MVWSDPGEKDQFAPIMPSAFENFVCRILPKRQVLVEENTTFAGKRPLCNSLLHGQHARSGYDGGTWEPTQYGIGSAK
jgi:hypothetical protein